MKRRVLLSFIMIVIFSLMAACSENNKSSSNESADNFEFKFSHVQPDDHPTTVAAEWMADELEEKTDGKITMKVYAGGSLGGPDENIAGMKSGDIDFSWVSTGQLARDIPELNLFSAGYLVASEEHFSKLADMDGELMGQLEGLVEEATIGSRLVGMMGGSQRRLFNNKRAVNKPEDLEGLDVRIQDSPIEAKTWELLGARPSPLALDELYTALQSNVVNGGEMSTSAYYSNKFHEVAKYHSLTDHQYGFLPLLMSDKTYEKLPEDLRDVVLEIAAEASEKSWEIAWDSDEEALKSLKEEGVEVNEVDIDNFKDKVESLIEDVADEYDAEDLLQTIRDAE